jgi:phytoene desaturase
MYDVVVIGAGLGGLACAVRLQAAGLRVVLVEARAAPGGRAGVLEYEGFRFDTGPTLITAPHLLRDLWESAGASFEDDVTLMPLRPYYRIVFADGRWFDYWGETERDEAEIARYSPSDVLGYRAFLRATERIYRRAFQDLAGQPFDRLSMFLRVVPELVRLRAHESVYRFVSRYFRDPRLRMVFSFHPLFIGGNPLRASAVYTIIPFLEREHGVFFARGGMGRLVSALTGLFQRLGGTIRYEVAVEQILVSGGRACGVRLGGGEVMPGRAVVSNADVSTTYLRLLPPGSGSRWLRRHLQRASYSMSCHLLYLGVRRRFELLRHHTIFMPHDYQTHLDELFDGDGTLSELAHYLHVPSRTDPTFAPPGADSVYVLTPVSHLGRYAAWDSHDRERFRSRVLATLNHLHGLAGLETDATVFDEWTPVEFAERLGSHLGAAFSLQPVLSQSAYFRPHNRTEVAGLYLVGAGTHPGAGIPGVLLSAQITSRLVLTDLGRARATMVRPNGWRPETSRLTGRVSP